MGADDPFSLAGRRALVTGGGSGIGRAVAERFVAAGAEVVVAGRRADLLAEVAGATPVVVDVAAPGAAAGLLDRAGPVDVVVHAAGSQAKAPAVAQTGAEWDATLAVHLRAFADLTAEVARRIADPPADVAVVAIGSMAARMGFRNVAAYAAAKGAVTSLVRALAVEWAPLGIRVNTVTPGWVDTDITRRAFAADPAHRDRIVARTPLGRIGDADDVALAALYLASPAARFVTGTDLVVDGGASVSL